MLVCERPVQTDHFQNNLAVGSKVTFLGEGESLDKHVFSEIKKLAYKLHADFPNNPWLSLDIYVDQVDQVGMFEFASEFGIQAIEKDILIKKAKSALDSLLKDLGII